MQFSPLSAEESYPQERGAVLREFCFNPQDVHKKPKNYTHCKVHKIAIYG